MASVIEDAETYQQSNLIVPPYLDASSDLVPLTNPASDLTVIRANSLGGTPRSEYSNLLLFIIFVTNLTTVLFIHIFQLEQRH